MQHEEFIELVRKRSGLASSGETEEVVRATLTTLGEYLTGGEGHDLASQLPQGVAEHLRRQPPERSEIFSLEDFLQRIGEHEGSGDIEEVSAHARAVMSVLDEAVSEGEMGDLRRQFPSEFAPLFES